MILKFILHFNIHTAFYIKMDIFLDSHDDKYYGFSIELYTRVSIPFMVSRNYLISLCS
jgi:hypothetical protein